MTNLLKILVLIFIITNTVKAYKWGRQTSNKRYTLWKAHISPEILNELKDFENLIPAATIDEIVAKHLFIDGNFRKAVKYLRSQEFTQLQQQLLNLPEVIEILEFLHLTTTNATTSHMGATTAKLITTDTVTASVENDNNNAITTSTDYTIRTVATNAIDGREEETFNNIKTMHKRPHTSIQFNSVDDDIASPFNLKQPLVRIVLLEDSVAKTNTYDVTSSNEDQHLNNHRQHSRKQHRHLSNNYHHHHHHHHEHQQSLGTFTAFVEEVLQHLPHAAYQNMIKDKCQKNTNFAEFYQALRSQEFKPLVEQTMQTANIKKIIETLNSHDVDVLALKPIAFQVISWGPNI